MYTKFIRGTCAINLLAPAALAASVAGPAAAADISSDGEGDDIAVIYVSGEIRTGDAAKFRREAARHDSAVVLLEGPGGTTVEAIEIGETIRLKGFATAVANVSDCNSACGLIWLAGTPRMMARSARIGFHATYRDSDGRLTESGLGNALVGRYFTLLNLPVKAVIFATSAPPSDLNWLTSSNYLEAGIETQIVDDLDEQPPASAPPTADRASSKAVSTFDTIGNWSIVVDHTLDDSCFLMSGFTDGTTLRIGLDLAYSKASYVMLGNESWGSLRVGDEHGLLFSFDDEEPWEVPSSVIEMQSSKFLMATFSDNSFWQDFAVSRSLKITRAGKLVARLNLEGSASAVDRLVDCQTKANTGRKPSDPFAD